ncbi:phasin-related domain-containing protein [Paraferrimonas sedimenticola]|uniref:Poly(Hydroxyalkanoate) granule-associated protein n=1 Tax=Paraferrimonas sedimenticola TaxID=375674 RepID=A0AA37RV86_9GAMM|nr:phasin family protein [Paraferrimonas sedimenticola]GLP95884.1 hypothetical protein GCM10007895_11900 [Paraferrimonas sedimenticola]
MLRKFFRSANKNHDAVIAEDAMARKIWLAGLGAYAKGFDEVNQLSARSREMFAELITEGRKVEADTSERIDEARLQTQDAIQHKVNQRVERVTGIELSQLKSLDDKLARLEALVEGLNAAPVNPEPVEQVVEPKPVARKAAPKPAPKPAVKAVAKPKPKAKPVTQTAPKADA